MAEVTCPYCGHQQDDPARCGGCGGYFEPMSRQATQLAMGPWYMRDEDKPFMPGFNAAVLFTALVTIFVSAVLFALRVPIANLFEATGITRDLIYLFCGPLSLAFFFPGVLFVANAAFNNLGQPFLSTLTNWGRNAVALIPLVFIGSWAFGAQGVLIGQALAAGCDELGAAGGADRAIPGRGFVWHRRLGAGAAMHRAGRQARQNGTRDFWPRGASDGAISSAQVAG